MFNIQKAWFIDGRARSISCRELEWQPMHVRKKSNLFLSTRGEISDFQIYRNNRLALGYTIQGAHIIAKLSWFM